MTYEDFICKAIDAGIDIDPYKPFDIDKESWYEKIKPKKRKNEDKNFLLQYWETGGVSGGSCWYSSDPRPYSLGDKEKPKGFLQLSKLLIEICPQLTFLQFQLIEEVIEQGNSVHYQYYGNCTEYSYEMVDLKKLYDKLVEIGVICNNE